MIRRKLKIRNPMGLHARPAGRFVAVVESHDARVRVRCRGDEVDGSSILSLLMLEAVVGTELEVVASGPDAESVLDALEALCAAGFEEAESYDGRGARG
ncbi:MAG: HPr family phosphocarrier protein [Deltaproteobacteria bacterium]|nr:HPr family phosphocarrier protein [Deltaproteobacteria bacterium]